MDARSGPHPPRCNEHRTPIAIRYASRIWVRACMAVTSGQVSASLDWARSIQLCHGSKEAKETSPRTSTPHAGPSEVSEQCTDGTSTCTFGLRRSQTLGHLSYPPVRPRWQPRYPKYSLGFLFPGIAVWPLRWHLRQPHCPFQARTRCPASAACVKGGYRKNRDAWAVEGT